MIKVRIFVIFYNKLRISAVVSLKCIFVYKENNSGCEIMNPLFIYWPPIRREKSNILRSEKISSKISNKEYILKGSKHPLMLGSVVCF